MRTIEEYRKLQQEMLAKEEYIRARQRLVIGFSYLIGEQRAEYKRHTALYGTSLESLQKFNLTCKGEK